MKTYYHANTKEVCNLLKQGKVRGKGISCWKNINLAIGWSLLHKGHEIVCVDVKDQMIKKGWTWGYIEKTNVLAVY